MMIADALAGQEPFWSGKRLGDRIAELVDLNWASLPLCKSFADAEPEPAGIDKIVLISHLQDIETDLDLIRALSGVDIVVAGGGGMAEPWVVVTLIVILPAASSGTRSILPHFWQRNSTGMAPNRVLEVCFF